MSTDTGTGEPRRFLFVLAGAREGGNSETLARYAATQLPPGAEQRWLRLADHPLPAFSDIRHDTEEYAEPTGPAGDLLDATLHASDLVIVSPLYWYSVSAQTKLYLDHWSAWLRLPGRDFKSRMAAKTFWGVTVLAGADHATAAPLEATLRLSAQYFGARWGGLLLGTGNWPGDVENDSAAMDRARTFFAA
jgi:multimeric flavodoxin WrbA